MSKPYRKMSKEQLDNVFKHHSESYDKLRESFLSSAPISEERIYKHKVLYQEHLKAILEIERLFSPS